MLSQDIGCLAFKQCLGKHRVHKPLLVFKQCHSIWIRRIRNAVSIQCLFRLVFMRRSDQLTLPFWPLCLIRKGLAIT